MRNDGTCGGVYLREYEREKTVRLERMARHCPVRTESITVTQELEWSVSGARFHSPEPLCPPRSPHSETQTHRSDSTVEENRHCPSKPSQEESYSDTVSSSGQGVLHTGASRTKNVQPKM